MKKTDQYLYMFESNEEYACRLYHDMSGGYNGTEKKFRWNWNEYLQCVKNLDLAEDVMENVLQTKYNYDYIVSISFVRNLREELNVIKNER